MRFVANCARSGWDRQAARGALVAGWGSELSRGHMGNILAAHYGRFRSYSPRAGVTVSAWRRSAGLAVSVHEGGEPSRNALLASAAAQPADLADAPPRAVVQQEGGGGDGGSGAAAAESRPLPTWASLRRPKPPGLASCLRPPATAVPSHSRWRPASRSPPPRRCRWHDEMVTSVTWIPRHDICRSKQYLR